MASLGLRFVEISEFLAANFIGLVKVGDFIADLLVPGVELGVGRLVHVVSGQDGDVGGGQANVRKGHVTGS